MAVDHVKNLIIDLHDNFALEQSSPSALQQQLMQQIKVHSHNLDEEEPITPNFTDTAELLLEEIREDHPKSAAIIKEVINILANMGI
ncbi:MAG: DUF4404 family protein [Pseudomonadales bacterium]|nr:DUF4404 family protein [Pseudomonadales bacterium]